MKILKIAIVLILAIVALMPGISAKLTLDGVTYDPAIITAGDRVDLIIQFHDEVFYEGDEKSSNPEYKFQVELKPDDDLTEEYVVIEDGRGDNMVGHVYPNQYYNKEFTVRFKPNAPMGEYEFKLTGTYVFENETVGYARSTRFTVPVRNEGILMGVSNIVTSPRVVRPGDDYVEVTTAFENLGEKDVKSVNVDLLTDTGIEASYADNNHKWIGRLNAGEQKTVTFYVDVDENATAGVHELNFKTDYLDLDNNNYSEDFSLPFRIESRPNLEVVNYSGSGMAGGDGKLKVWVKNIGAASAESVDVRLLKQNSQPFDFDVRSNYIGEINPGETGLAVFNLGINSDAALKNHHFNILIRAKGDSEKGDDNIYTFERQAKFEVVGIAPNKIKSYGYYAVIGVALLILLNVLYKAGVWYFSKNERGAKNAKR